MKSALQIVAFSRANRTQGVINLLETALEELDEQGCHFEGACIATALENYINRKNDNGVDSKILSEIFVRI